MVRVNTQNQYILSINLVLKLTFLILVFCQTRSYKKGRREHKTTTKMMYILEVSLHKPRFSLELILAFLEFFE
jgi:hypothetical protein